MSCFFGTRVRNINIDHLDSTFLQGIITSFGHKAVTIKQNNNREWYGKRKYLSKEILSLLELNELPIKVVFKANLKKWSGRHNFGPRYYATHVELIN